MIFTFHKPETHILDPLQEDAFDTVEAVPETVSLWAIIFPAPWLIWHKLWFELVVYVLVMALFLGLANTEFRSLSLALYSLPGLYLWLEGHNLRRTKLARQGYQLLDVVEAPDEATAFARFVDKTIQQGNADRDRLCTMGLAA